MVLIFKCLKDKYQIWFDFTLRKLIAKKGFIKLPKELGDSDYIFYNFLPNLMVYNNVELTNPNEIVHDFGLYYRRHKFHTSHSSNVCLKFA